MPDGFEALATRLSCSYQPLTVEGCAAFVFMPVSLPADRIPWVWYAPTFAGRHPGQENAWVFRRLLERGVAVAGVDVGESYGSPAGRMRYGRLYDDLTRGYRLSLRPVLLPQSRGGLMLYAWATENPDKVAAVAGIFPVCDLRSYPGLEKACGAYGLTADELAAHLAEHNPIDRIGALAQAGVPILHVHGDRDALVPLEDNSRELQRRYRERGGAMRIIVVPGGGHAVTPAFFECEPLVEFAIRWAERSHEP